MEMTSHMGSIHREGGWPLVPKNAATTLLAIDRGERLERILPLVREYHPRHICSQTMVESGTTHPERPGLEKRCACIVTAETRESERMFTRSLV